MITLLDSGASTDAGNARFSVQREPAQERDQREGANACQRVLGTLPLHADEQPEGHGEAQKDWLHRPMMDATRSIGHTNFQLAASSEQVTQLVAGVVVARFEQQLGLLRFEVE